MNFSSKSIAYKIYKEMWKGFCFAFWAKQN